MYWMKFGTQCGLELDAARPVRTGTVVLACVFVHWTHAPSSAEFGSRVDCLWHRGYLLDQKRARTQS